MSLVDYGQTTEDHQSLLVLVRHTGSLLNSRKFTKAWERIQRLTCVPISSQSQNNLPSQMRNAWVRYKRFYPKENNEWGDFQAHRKTLGLISIGECSNGKEFEDLFDKYKKVKEEYAGTLFNSRLIVFGMNRDGSELRQSQNINEGLKTVKGTNNADDKVSDNSSADSLASCSSVEQEKISQSTHERDKSHDKILGGRCSPSHSEDSGVTSDISPTETVIDLQKSPPTQNDDALKSSTIPKDLSSDSKSDDGGQITFISTKSKDSNKKKVNKTMSKEINNKENQPGGRSHSNSLTIESSGAEVLFFPSEEDCDDLDDKLREFITSLFFVLEGKRLDRSFERQDRMVLLCAPFEKKDYVGLDTDTKSFKKKCQGRLRKHLADLCLQAGIPGEAILHYQTAIDILRPVNDLLWIGACLEGLCSASVIVTYPKAKAPTLRRNYSLSTKRGSSMMSEVKQRTGSIKQSYSNGLQDLPGTAEINKMALPPEDIIEKYKDVLTHYSKFKNAAIIEMEASLKACRVLILQSKILQASDFLQNVIYINLKISDEDTINRYCTLSQLYSEIGFHRKAAFFKRIAAMQSVAPQNPKHNWSQCYSLLLQTLRGYSITFDPTELNSGGLGGWPVLQARVLNELIFSARKMGQVAVAIRHTTFLLHALQSHLSASELREICNTLNQLSGRCPAIPHSLALDNGTILPPVALANIPYIKSFKLVRMRPHLEPSLMNNSSQSAVTGPFIFTPLILGSNSGSSDTSKVDFSLVANDLCEVQLMVYNSMPDELKITQMSLLTEGVELESYPTSPTIPAESGPYLVKILSRPKTSGELTITGYTTQVFGVKSICKLKDLHQLDMREVRVNITPELPQIHLTTSLPKAATFPSGQDSACVVTSATTVLYAGQCVECLVTIQNTSLQPVDQINVSVNCRPEERDFLLRLFHWNEDNIASQLPLQPNSIMCFTLYVTGTAAFLPNSDICSQDDAEPKCVESLIRVEYSGGPGLTANYCRRCAINFSVDIFPSVIFLNWDAIPAKSCDHCYLVFDLQNVSEQQLQLSYDSEQSLIFTPNQIRRIAVQIERCLFPPEPESDVDRLNTIATDMPPVDHYSAYLSKFVDIHWTIPSAKVHGKVSLDHLTWTAAQLQQIAVSTITWDVRINNKELSLTKSGEVAVCTPIDIDIDITSKAELIDQSVLLSASCIQCQQSSAESENIMTLGINSRRFEQVSVGELMTLQTAVMFTSPGTYSLDIKCVVQSKTSSETATVYKYHPIKLVASCVT